MKTVDGRYTLQVSHNPYGEYTTASVVPTSASGRFRTPLLVTTAKKKTTDPYPWIRQIGYLLAALRAMEAMEGLWIAGQVDEKFPVAERHSMRRRLARLVAKHWREG